MNKLNKRAEINRAAIATMHGIRWESVMPLTRAEAQAVNDAFAKIDKATRRVPGVHRVTVTTRQLREITLALEQHCAQLAACAQTLRETHVPTDLWLNVSRSCEVACRLHGALSAELER